MKQYKPSANWNTSQYTVTTTGTTTGVGSTNWIGMPGTVATSGYIHVMSPEPIYTTFKLPRANMPQKVYVDGVLMTCGILGSDAECAYTSKDNIVFAPEVFSAEDVLATSSGRGPTMSIEYADAIYHYSIKYVPVKGDGTKIIETAMLGKVKIER